MNKPNDPSDVSLTAEVNPLTSGRILTEPPEKLSLVEQVHAHVILKKVGESIESRLKELREPLLAIADTKGEVVSEKGTRKYVVEGNSICAEHRTASAPDGEKIIQLLASKGMGVSEAFDAVTTMVLNPSKLEHLVQIGKLTKEEVEAAIPPLSSALRIYPSKHLKEVVDSLGLKGKSLHENGKALPEKK